MYYDISEVITTKEIELLRKMIESIKQDSVKDYFFDEELINKIVCELSGQESLRTLVIKKIIELSDIKYCEICGEEFRECECDDKKLSVSNFYNINLEFFKEYYKRTIENKYKLKFNNITKNEGYELLYFEGSNYNVEFEFYSNVIPLDYISDNNSHSKIILSLMPVTKYNENQTIFEWYELLDSENVDNILNIIKSIDIHNKSKNFYNFDLGDDIDISDVEMIRDVLRKYLKRKGFLNSSEVAKYKPEIISYNIPIEKIKESYTKDLYKILILKPSEKEISIIYFCNGQINSDSELYLIINEFDSFIKTKSEKLRALKKEQNNASLTEKILQFFGPIINVSAFIFGIITKNKIFSSVYNLFDNKIIITLFLVVNIISILAIFYFSVLPYIKLRIFKWSRKVEKI